MILDKIRNLIHDLVCYEKNNSTIRTSDDLSISQVRPRGVICLEYVELNIIFAPVSVDAREEAMVAVVAVKARI